MSSSHEELNNLSPNHDYEEGCSCEPVAPVVQQLSLRTDKVEVRDSSIRMK